MKTNLALHSQIGLGSVGGSASKVWYAANVLKTACVNSPPVKIRSASPAIPYRPARPAQTEKAYRPASVAVSAANNTTGYVFGELYLNSPAYPIGTAIPPISPKLASAAVLAQPEIIAQPAISAYTTPAIVAIKGWEDAINFQIASDHIIVTAELPVNKGALLVGSPIETIGEMTPSALQVTAWVGAVESTGSPSTYDDAAYATLEQFLYAHALATNNAVVTDIIRSVNGVNIPCKRVEVQLGITSNFASNPDFLKLSDILYPVSFGS